MTDKIVTPERLKKFLGVFTDKFDAICARLSAKNKHQYHINHGG